MRSFSLLGLLCTLLLLASVTRSSPDAVAKDVYQRAESTTSATTDSSTSETQSSQMTTTGTQTGTQTNSETSETGTHTGTNAGANSTSSQTISTYIDPRLPAGGVTMTNPPATTTTYYRVGNNITFGWNYTSVLVTPTAVDVIATCSLNSATYTIANNLSWATSSVTWDTDEYQATATIPFLTASYTLVIYEAGKAPSDVAGAGYLGTYDFPFGMYLSQQYSPLNDYVCVTCNAAVSGRDRQALGLLFTVATITVISFTLFAGGFGVFS